MKNIFIILMLAFSFSFLHAEDKTDLILQEIKGIKEDIKVLREDMNKRFEQVDRRFEQVDKRFEQVDRRFDQVDKRLDFMQNILYALMGLIFASPFIAIYLRDKRENEERKLFDSLKGILFVLREMAQDDEKMAKALRSANLM